MTPTFCCGFECGVGAAHWDFSPVPAFSTTTIRSGLRSCRCNPSATISHAIKLLTSASIVVTRFYINAASNPNVDTFIGGLGVHTLGGEVGLLFKSSDSKYYAGRVDASNVFTFGATGVTLSAGWHLIDIRADLHLNPWVTDVQIDSAALGSLSSAVAADTVDSIIIGNQQNSTFDIFYDDVVVSATTGDYPIGAGKVLSFVPAADGTHTFTSTHAILGTTGAPTTGSNITSATTNAFSFVNARPIGGGATDATRLWNQATLLSTEYAEVTIEQTTEINPPRAVEVLVIAREASSTTCNSTFKVNDNGTENTVYAMTVPVGNSDEFKTKQYATMPADSAAWTLARFRGLKLRWGYSSDATPDVYCRGWMVEAEFPESLDASAFGDRPMGQVGQGVMNQLLAQ